MAATGIEEDALTARLRGVLDKAQQVQASIAVLEKDHKTPCVVVVLLKNELMLLGADRCGGVYCCVRTDVLEKLNVLAGTEVARLLSEVNPILKHYVARPGNGNVSHAALSACCGWCVCSVRTCVRAYTPSQRRNVSE